MALSFDFNGEITVVTGACGALGSSVSRKFIENGSTICAIDIIDIDDDDSLLEPQDAIHFYQIDATDEADVESSIGEMVEKHDQIDNLCNIAGTWRGGHPIEQTALDEVKLLFNVNFVTAFLMTKHALPHLQQTNGSIVNVSSRSSLEGGEGDGPYRAMKAGIRRLTETVAEENKGTVRANAIMPSVIDTPMNREMMEPSDEWVDPEDIADVIMWLCSDVTAVTSGAAIPVYGEA